MSKKRYAEHFHHWKVIKINFFHSTVLGNMCPRSFLLSTCTWVDNRCAKIVLFLLYLFPQKNIKISYNSLKLNYYIFEAAKIKIETLIGFLKIIFQISRFLIEWWGPLYTVHCIVVRGTRKSAPPRQARGRRRACLMVACIPSGDVGLVGTDTVAALSVRWRPA